MPSLAKEHVGHRVTVSGHTGILQGLPDSAAVIWDEDAQGILRIPCADHSLIEDARLTCERCAKLCNALFDHPDRTGLWCAECARPFAQTHQAKNRCEECGAIGGAVRNPRRGVADQRILCRQCHARAGSVVIVPGAFVRESDPLPGGQDRPTCAAANVPGTVQCDGAIKPRRPTGENLCNVHAGTARIGERNPRT